MTKHSKTAIHSKSMESLQSTSRLTSFIERGYDKCNKVVYAETKFVYFIAKSNLPFTVCNEFSKMVGEMFQDSDNYSQEIRYILEKPKPHIS